MYVFVCDPNAVHHITYKEVKVFCEKKWPTIQKSNIHTSSQTIKINFFDEITGRIKFTKELKKVVQFTSIM